MALITYEDKEELNENIDIPDKNKTTADDMNMIKNAINSMWNQQYPVGRIVMFYDLEDHSDYLGFTWQRCLVGKFPVGYDSSDTDFNTIGKTGGEKEHTLTLNQIPEHNHELYGALSSSSSGTRRINTLNATYSQMGLIANDCMQEVGGGQPHNNLPPYEVVAYWRRTA